VATDNQPPLTRAKTSYGSL